jgi:integrase
MKQRYYLYRRRQTYYLQDSRTGKQQSLETKDRQEALRLLEIKRQSATDPAFNQIMLRTCLATQDSKLAKRTWQTVMDQIQTHGRESSQTRYARAVRHKAFDSIRKLKLVETTSEDFLAVLNGASVSVCHYLKRLHNLALGLGWLPLPVLAPRLWPRLRYKPKRAVTLAEHQLILAAELNPERNRYYQMLWEIGASQSDAALLSADNIDPATNTLSYFRLKTGEQAVLTISNSLATLLRELPSTGLLFPKIAVTPVNVRAADFFYLCKRLKIQGITLHSYRYAWAERAKSVGMPERFAMENLGHNSKAVHRAYAKRALMKIPSLEDYEEKAAAQA